MKTDKPSILIVEDEALINDRDTGRFCVDIPSGHALARPASGAGQCRDRPRQSRKVT